ncbi:DNA-directed RNA polymerase subunit alpha [Candidatus Falkowbacteria bacterium RBG_13_39_14]|uniref:DNA-directed RNA polymerase subunit alpha n=1 Tax=Candidatus Falkowbacteria bacterium RBG_13_39_14 TaxID=1797985 RepID=A0A1F5S8J0_9BACT|nr:MAG: DNA-directed RNA polymerase subunit alpha [Candidatus Falkowbacteria bacterium RBG_13_39_14]
MNIPLPNKFEITEDKKNPKLGIVVIEPCFPGYGITIGNAIRRVLLSSLEGAAVTSVKIKDVQHEFSTIPNVKEDVLEIILNLKKLRLKIFTDEPVKLEIKAKGEKEITAADIGKNNDVEIVNTDFKIATLTNRNAELSMELTVEKGLGYTSADQQEAKTEGKEIGNIAIDSVFTPIVNVALNIENVRVGQMTNYEKLIFNIETDGTIAIKDAVEKSAKILIDHFGLFMGEEGDKTKSKSKKKEEKDAEGEEK